MVVCALLTDAIPILFVGMTMLTLIDSLGRNTFSWYHSAENHGLVLDFENRAIAAMRSGTEEEDFVDYVNCNRIDPIERRFRGKKRLDRLKMLKMKWDPQGVFTKQLL